MRRHGHGAPIRTTARPDGRGSATTTHEIKGRVKSQRTCSSTTTFPIPLPPRSSGLETALAFFHLLEMKKPRAHLGPRRNSGFPLQRHRTVKRPRTIDSLPFEILATIFLFIHSAAKKPLDWARLGWVCAYWRQVFLHTEHLWTDLRFTASSDLALISDLLSRSGELYLHVEVYTARCNPGHILDRVLQHRNRLRSLSITYRFDQTPFIQAALDVVMPRLQSLLVRATDTPPRQPTLRAASPFSRIILNPLSVPELQFLHICSLQLDVAASTLQGLIGLGLYDFEELIHLIGWNYPLELVEACAETLQELTIYDVPWFTLHNHPQPEIRFNQLRTLHVKDSSGSLMSRFLGLLRLPRTTRLRLHYQWDEVGWSPTRDTAVFNDRIFPYERRVREESLPGLLETRRIRLQVGHSYFLTGYSDGTGLGAPSWCATADLSGTSREISCLAFGPMVGALTQLVNRNLVEDYECHLPPHLPTYDHVPNIVWAFPNLRRFTLGPVRVINEAFSDILASQSGIRTLQELVFCIAEVDQSLIATLLKCKKLRLKHGKSVLPAKLILRLPRHLASCNETKAKIFSLRTSLTRIVQLEVVYRDCGFCHRRLEKLTKLPRWEGRPEPRLTPNDAEWWDFTP
ncbi:hypothetical protein FKP32DRAFT_499638 [Trametes sanguinea]|nr:hypothetical protein FKP32DRAFT_499638 [Trametes sanguinea]